MTATPEAVIRSGLREGVQRYPLWQTEAALDTLEAENARLAAELAEAERQRDGAAECLTQFAAERDEALRVAAAWKEASKEWEERAWERQERAEAAESERDEALRVADQLRAALAPLDAKIDHSLHIGTEQQMRADLSYLRGLLAECVAALSSEGQPRESVNYGTPTLPVSLETLLRVDDGEAQQGADE